VEVQRLSNNNQPTFLLEESLRMDHLEDAEEIEDTGQIMTDYRQLKANRCLRTVRGSVQLTAGTI
jgi:hypothetical protein